MHHGIMGQERCSMAAAEPPEVMETTPLDNSSDPDYIFREISGGLGHHDLVLIVLI